RERALQLVKSVVRARAGVDDGRERLREAHGAVLRLEPDHHLAACGVGVRVEEVAFRHGGGGLGEGGRDPRPPASRHSVISAGIILRNRRSSCSCSNSIERNTLSMGSARAAFMLALACARAFWKSASNAFCSSPLRPR